MDHEIMKVIDCLYLERDAQISLRNLHKLDRAGKPVPLFLLPLWLFYSTAVSMHISGNFLVGVAVFIVALVLFAGLINMMRGGSPELSQKLMRWRVGLQFIAVIIIMCVLYFRGG